MAPTTFVIAYSKPGTVPPIFVAGSFTSPPWEPQELHRNGGESSGSFSRAFSVDPGTYQYKFRLGTGDWWVVDEAQETAPDGQGNVNNVLTVEDIHQIPMSPSAATAEGEDVAERRPTDTNSPDSFPRAGGSQLPLAATVPEIRVQNHDATIPSLASTISSGAAKVIPIDGSVSHDLPTPPLSEGGDEIEATDVLPKHAEKLFQNSEDPTSFCKKSEGKTSSVSSKGWSPPGVIVLALGLVIVPIVAWSLRQ